MAKYLNIILAIFILAKFQHAKADIVPAQVKEATHLAIQELVVYYGFLDDPVYVLSLFAKFTGFTSDPKKTAREVTEINRKMDELSENVLRFENEIMRELDKNLEHAEMTKKLDHIYFHVGQVNRRYRQNYMNYINESRHYSAKTRKDFADKVMTTGTDGINNHLEEMHRYLLEVDTTRKNIPMYYAEDNDFVRSLMCAKKQSAQRLIYNTYELIVATELQGLAMMIYAHDLQKEGDGPENETLELSDAKDFQKVRLNNTFNAIKRIAANAPREIWPCDPKVHELGNTYEKVGPFLQKYVMWEGNVRKDPGAKIITSSFTGSYVDWTSRYQDLCQSSCPSLTYVDAPYCNEHLCQASQFVCKGHTRDCEKLSGKSKICLANNQDDRRYKYIRTGNGKTYGSNDSCPHGEFEAHSQFAFGTTFDCDYCLCTCQDTSMINIKKYVDLTPVYSNGYDNKVITGLRIVNVNNTFRIQIEEGTLLPKGRIDRDSVEWVKLTPFHLDHEIADDEEDLEYFDYHELTWYDRTFVLEDLVKEGEVLTAIRFMNDEQGYIKLAIKTRPFDLETGELRKWTFEVFNNNEGSAAVAREEFKPKKYEVPTKYFKHMPDSISGQYMNLTTSDVDQDAGQNVVPFFDTQPVNSSYPMPLSGVGLVHKGFSNSAGFLALKLINLDINKLTSHPKV